MNDHLLERVRRFLQRRDLLRPDALLLVAVSGGPDSLCLLHLLNRLRTGGPALHVAHLDHGARGEQSAAEARAVADLAVAWGLPITVARRDLPAQARAAREGLMAAGRRVRYAFLAATARAIGADAVLVAHQADDQAETVLMHIVRGSGLAGLRGMREELPWAEWAQEDKETERQAKGSDLVAVAFPASRSPALLRPLLTTPRAEIEAYCAAHKLQPVQDPSNSAPRFTRTRTRQTLRALATENPRLSEALGRLARLAADDLDFIETQLDLAWSAVAAKHDDAVLLDRAAWLALHPALQRQALRRAAALLDQRELSLEQVEAARALASQSGHQMQLGPDLWLQVDQQSLSLFRMTASPALSAVQLSALGLRFPTPPPQLPVDSLALNLGSTAIGAGWSCELRETVPDQPSPLWVALDPSTLDGPLALRRRRPGDRFRPLGGPGSRRLQDFFIDRRLPRGLRDAWPLLVTPGAVVWVVGLSADERFVVRHPSQGTIWVGLVRDEQA
jgi:tRNA(Ile)-lysidine synthase